MSALAGAPVGRYARILVGLDRTTGAERTLSAAIAAATDNAILTLLGSVARPHWLVCFSGYSPLALLSEAEEQCAALLRGAAGQVPRHLGVRTMLQRGALGRALATEAAASRYDLIAVQAPGPRRVLRTCPTPVLFTPAA